MKEVRNGNLIATIKTAMPNVGHVKIATKDGRKASFVFRGIPFFASSRLVVKEIGIGKDMFKNTADTDETIMLTNRLKAIA